MMKMKEYIEGSWHEEGREIENAWENIEKNEEDCLYKLKIKFNFISCIKERNKLRKPKNSNSLQHRNSL